MSNFVLLEQEIGPTEIFVKRYEDPRRFDNLYAKGKPIAPEGESTVIFHEEGRKTDFLAGVFSFPVVSARFEAILRELEPDHLEFHPIDLIDTRCSDTDRTYCFVNVLDPVSCLDWERSEVRTMSVAPNVILGIEKLVIKEDALVGRHICRMAEFKTLLLVSSTLRQRIEEAGLTGIGFKDIAEYRF